MKNIIRISIIAACAALSLVACNKEIENPAENPANEGIKVTVITGNVETKTALTGTTTVSWLSTDKLGLVHLDADADNREDVQAACDGIDGEGKATFTGTVTKTGEYFAYYPYNDGAYAPSESGAVLRIKTSQSPTNGTTFDPAADVLVSEAFTVAAAGEETTATTLLFKRLGAFLKVYFADNTTGSKLSGLYASTVSVQSNGVGAVSLAAKLTISPSGIVSAAGAEKTITATYPSDTYEVTNASQAAYLGVQPVTIPAGSQLIFTVETAKYTISKTVDVPSNIVLGSGDIQPIKITVGDSNITPKLQIEKVWEKMSTSSVAWTTTLTDGVVSGTAGADFNIAVDGNYVYVPEFGSTKRIWAISVTDGSAVKLVNNSTVTSTGFDGSIYMSCARVVKKSDGTPVLLATNLFDDNNGKLYVWDNGIDNAPRVVTLNQYDAGRRLGDKFTTYGNFEDCWLIFGTQTGNGFVTFKVPESATSAGLISRLATTTTDFATYYPFPGDITQGMFAWHGGTHDDGGLYRNRYMTIADGEAAIKDSGAHTATVTKLDQWMDNSENNNGTGFNYIEFNGKRYVIWCLNSTDSKKFDLMIKEGTTATAWNTIINTTGTVKRDAFSGAMATTWKNSADCAVWNDGTDVYIAINKQQVGIALYHMYMPD